MKKLFLILGLLSTLFISCSKEDDKATLELSEKASILNVENTAVQKSITVFTNQKTWSATENAEWINTKQNSDKLDIEISANETESERQADITFKAGNATKKITIKQAAGKKEEPKPEDPTLTINPEGNIEATADGLEQTITVTTNQKEWKAEKTEAANWITLTQESNKLNIVVAANETYEARTAEITISAATLTKKITVNQAAGEKPEEPTLIINPDGNIEATADGLEQTIEVVTNQTEWKAEKPETASWITLKQNGNKLIISVAANETTEARTAEITISAATLTKKITVNQAGKETVTPSSDEIVLGYTDFANVTGEKILAYEKEAGSIYSTTESSEGYYVFNIKTENKYGLISRIYYFNEETKDWYGCYETFTKIDMFFNADKSNLSDSYIKILKDNGYNYVNVEEGYYNYENEEKGISLFISYQSSSETNLGKPAVEIIYYPTLTNTK